MLNNISKIRFIAYRYKRRIIKSSLSLYFWRDKLPYYLGFKTPQKKDMPDFIIAGLPKCGTYWLVHALKADSQFEFVTNPFNDKGEIRFFSINFNQPISQYFKAFNSRTDLSKLAFEKSPDYAVLSKARIRLIKKLNPEIKIILMFRDPVDRIFSNTKMDLVRKQDIKLNEGNGGRFLRSYRSQFESYDYESVLKNWRAVFKKSQILILSLEDVVEQPERVLDKAYHYLEREKKSNLDLREKKNETVSKPIPKSHREYIEKNIASTIDYWESNQSIFRLN